MLPNVMTDVSAQEVARVFGSEFAATLHGLPQGAWSEPVPSAYGLHLVFIDDVVPERAPSLDEVRGALERDLLRARTIEANDAYYESLREKYAVRMSAASTTIDAGPQ
jgi:parvulin-like peptidyl-prolyl isomerase